MSDSIVAYRYAKSLIDLAAEKNVVDQVNEDMDFFITLCEENKQLVAVLKSPIVRHLKKLSILQALFEGKVHPVTYGIFSILTKKNRESLIYSLAIEFKKLYNQLNGIQIAKISTASELTSDQRNDIIRQLTDDLKKTIILQEEVNPDLIGGFVLQVNDSRKDTSIRKKLNELALDLA